MTILYNTTTNNILKVFRKRYLVDGKEPELPDHIVQLNVVRQDRPVPAETQKVVIDHYPDLPNNEYVYGYKLVDLTQEELDEKASRLANQQKTQMAENFLDNLDVENMNQSQLINAVKALVILNR